MTRRRPPADDSLVAESAEVAKSGPSPEFVEDEGSALISLTDVAEAWWRLPAEKLAARWHPRDILITSAAVVVVVILIAVARAGLLPFHPQSGYAWDFAIVWQYIPTLLIGLRLTLLLTVLGMSLGMSLGVLVALARLSRSPVIRWPVIMYIEIMRGTPALVQLIWVYYALPIVTGIQLQAVEAVVLAMTLNMGAFYGEAFRAGIQSVPREQTESARVLGLSHVQRQRYVVIPQAMRNVLPVLVSLSISLFKDTSLVSVLGVADLLYKGDIISDTTYRPLEVFTTVAVIYFIIAFPATILLRRLEVHLSRHKRAVK